LLNAENFDKVSPGLSPRSQVPLGSAIAGSSVFSFLLAPFAIHWKDWYILQRYGAGRTAAGRIIRVLPQMQMVDVKWKRAQGVGLFLGAFCFSGE